MSPRERKRARITSFPADSDESPIERAQTLVYDALEASTEQRRAELARQALALSPDCADAYLILVEQASTVSETHALLREALAAGERALAGRLESLVSEGAMWLELDSRPYLRALAMLASFEWDVGDRQAAIERGWELLRLDPNDHQGMRYVQLLRLLHAGSLEQIDRLLALYGDDATAAWTFGRALHLYRSRGPGAEVDAALREAKRLNHHVVPLLLGERSFPAELPEFIGFGDESEAVAYAWDALGLWVEAPGALGWLDLKRGPSGMAPGARRRKKR